MVRIRLTRKGAKKRPFYRVIAADSRAPRDGKFLEQLGYYDPMKEPSEIKLDLERIDFWISNGASPSDTVNRLVKTARAQATEQAAAEAKS